MWKTIGASVAGFSHQAEGTPCQDCHAISLAMDGWLVAAISDGAGSAPRSAEGARAVCDGVVSHIVAHLSLLGSDTSGAIEETAGRLLVAEAVESVRASLIEISSKSSIAEFHATLVGVIAGPSGGLFFHIGDGAACATDAQNLTPTIMSLPENGEYANETFFVTQSDWHGHLRLKSFNGQFNLIALMSDGVTPFALGPGAEQPHAPFFHPISRYLAGHTQEEGEKALAATLARDAVRSITGDDKTFVWARRIDRGE